MSPEKVINLPEATYLAFKRALAESEWFFEQDRTLFAIAPGAHRSAMFEALGRNPEIEIVWCGSYLP